MAFLFSDINAELSSGLSRIITPFIQVKLHGENQLPKVITGVKFCDGCEGAANDERCRLISFRHQLLRIAPFSKRFPHEGSHITHTVCETPLVIIPGQNSAEFFPDNLGLGNIKNRTGRMVIKVNGHKRFGNHI